MRWRSFAMALALCQPAVAVAFEPPCSLTSMSITHRRGNPMYWIGWTACSKKQYCVRIDQTSAELLPTAERAPLVPYLIAHGGIAARPMSPDEMKWCVEHVLIPQPGLTVARNPASRATPNTRPLYDPQWKVIGRAEAGKPCEADSVRRADGKMYHWHTNMEGKRGLTVCVR